MEREPGDQSFLSLCERLFALSLEHEILLSRASEAVGKGDQDTVEQIVDAIDDNAAERRILLWRIQEIAGSAAVDGGRWRSPARLSTERSC
jgi:hypothetical protein